MIPRPPQKSAMQNRRGKNTPLSLIQNAKWNVFEDTAAFKTYFTLFILGYTAFATWHLFAGQIHPVLSGSVLAAASLFPAYLWLQMGVKGLPIFPLYAFTFFYTFSVQFIIRVPLWDTLRRFQADPSDLWNMSLIASASLLAGTLGWYWQTRQAYPSLPTCRSFQSGYINQALLILLASSAVMTVLIASEKLPFLGKFYSAAMAFCGTAGTLSSFILAYRLGRKELGKTAATTALVFLILSMTASAASLLLVTSLSMAGVSVAGFALGRKKVPVVPLLLMLPFFYVLHQGKGDMRVKYWNRAQSVASVGLADYPAYFLEWFNFGIENIKKPTTTSHDAQTNIIERTGIISIFFTAYKLSPDPIPYLEGASYRDLPLMFVPRIFYPKKPVSHSGQRLINVHYKLQDEASTLTTTIGWGLFCEAYANYGTWGTTLFGFFCGWVLGWMARVTAGVPMLSMRGMFGVLFLAMSFQSEMTSGVMLASLFQAVLIMLFIGYVLMKPVPNPFYIPFEATVRSGPRSVRGVRRIPR